jgi:ribulose-5-phosphate 4-epimerase/fuculose-1-phosphate aldolase
MRNLLLKYESKLEGSGIAEPGTVVMGGLDDTVTWNRSDEACVELEKVFGMLNINSLLFARPAEPYWSIISLLASEADGAIRPEDCETRTFLHDIPVSGGFSAAETGRLLRGRKSAVVPGRGIVTWGAVSPEQAFIFFSSVCFSCFVKFFSDYLGKARRGEVGPEWAEVFCRASSLLDELPSDPPALLRGPLRDEASVRRAIAEAGLRTVELRLVDSFFGNVSFHLGGVLYISQTASSLDELAGAIDACPLDGSSCAAITASSEYSAHAEILRRTGASGVLHGHPKFCVIASMDCGEQACGDRGSCHVSCPRERYAGDVPIVPGEVGTGPTGLCNTLPGAMVGNRGAIVYGHGLFVPAYGDFDGSLRAMIEIERMCREIYFSAIPSRYNPIQGRGR